MKSLIVTVSILTLLCSAISAHERFELWEMSLEELLNVQVVSASKYPQSLLESPSAISIISHEDIEYAPAQNVPELLQYVVGMDGYTKTLTDMDVAARGFAYDETPKMLVAIDGQVVNVVPYGGMQWPTLPLALDDIERIEVVRGSASSIYGADALVGVINIITREAKQRENTVSLSYGERGMGRFRVQLVESLGKNWNVAVSGGFTQTEEKGDAETAEAKLVAPNYGLKDWANIYMGTFRLDYRKEGLSFSSLGGYSTDKEGYNPSPGDRSIDMSEKQTFFVTNQFATNIGRDCLTFRLGYRTLGQENQKWDTGKYVFKYKITKADAVDFDANYIVRRFQNSTLIGGISASYLQASRDIANTQPYTYDENDQLISAYAQEELKLFDHRLAFTFGGRYDKWSSLDGVISPKAAVNLWVVKSRLNFRLSAGSSFRRPAFDENSYFVTWPGGWFKGSMVDATTESGQSIEGDLLKPEKLLAYEAGFRFAPDGATLIDIEAFHHQVQDNIGYIVYEASDDALNIGFANTGDKVSVAGLETELRRYFTKRLSVFLNYTYQSATINYENGTEEEWTNAPDHKTSGGIRYLGLLNVDARFRYVSELAYQEVSSILVDDYWTLDLAISKRFASGLNLKLVAQNLLDNGHYEYPLYTMIKRQVSFGLRYNF